MPITPISPEDKALLAPLDLSAFGPDAKVPLKPFQVDGWTEGDYTAWRFLWDVHQRRMRALVDSVSFGESMKLEALEPGEALKLDTIKPASPYGLFRIDDTFGPTWGRIDVLSFIGSGMAHVQGYVQDGELNRTIEPFTRHVESHKLRDVIFFETVEQREEYFLGVLTLRVREQRSSIGFLKA